MADNKKVIISVVINDAGAKTKLKEISNETNNLGNRADKASKGFLGLGKTFTAISRGFVIVKSFQLLARAITSTIKVAAEFELTMAKVQAITGATDEDFKKLTDSARELALGTIFTASQVGELQLAYAKLGFTTEEILNATEATLNLATATGEDLAGAADVVGSVIRGFNLDASETTRVVDVMAKSFSSSALNLENFKQSMKTVAPIANAANVDLETTTALLGTLADSGLRGTRAATGLKNLMSQLTDPTSKLAQELGYTIENSEGLIHAFRDLSERNIDLAKATGLTDERSKAAFITLINGTSNVEDLKTTLDRASGSANRMANIVGNTLTGSFKTFQSQIEETQIAVTNSAILKTILDNLSIALARLRDGTELARELKAEIESTPYIKEDFKDVIKAEKEFYAERTLNNKLFAQENQRILEETNDSEIASQEIKKRTIEKRKQDDEAYLAFLKNQRELLVKPYIDATNFLDKLAKEGKVDLIAKNRLLALQEANNNLKKEINAVEESLKKTSETIDGLNKILPSSTDNVYNWGAAWASADKDLQGMFSTGEKVYNWARGKDLLGSLFQGEFSDPDEYYGNIEKSLNNLINNFRDLEVQTQNSPLAYALGISDQQLAEIEEGFENALDSLANFNQLAQTLFLNRLLALEAVNQADLKSFEATQDEKLKKYDINQKHQLDTFIGSESAKADFEKQKGLERLEFEKKQEIEREKLRKKQLEEENKIAKNAFIANKINSLAQIAINTALAISKATAQFTVAAPAVVPFLIASGALQAATVASQKFQPRTFQDGGIVSGALHRDGGVPFTVKGQGGFEMEGGEYIMSRKAVNKVGVDFLDRINFDGKAPDNSYMFANGGVVPRVQNNAINQAELADMIGEAIAMRISQIPVINVATDTSSISRKVFNAQSMATF